MALVPAPPESALPASRCGYRQSMIPRPSSNTKAKEPEADTDLSPKSVIVDRRFISPGGSTSSTSSSMDLRNTGRTESAGREGHRLKGAGHEQQPRHDRGYSISDGEFSDPDCFVDSSAGTSVELRKVGNSGPLESLPETHSLALEAATTPNRVSADLEASDPPTSSNDLESSEPVSLFTSREQNCDSRRGEHGSSPLSSAALRSDKIYQEADQDTSVPMIPRSSGDIILSSINGNLQNPAAIQSADEDENGEWSSQTSTSRGSSASEHDTRKGNRSSSSESASTGRINRDHNNNDNNSRPAAFSSEQQSTSGSNQQPVERRCSGPVVGQGAASNFGYPGTPFMRFSPSWTQGTVPTVLNAVSPRVEKGVPGSFSPASAADLPMGLRYQHRFLSGPILGSMIPKPSPSKWDDAEKWIVSPGHSDQSPAQQAHHRPSLPSHLTGRRNSTASAQSFRSTFGADSPDYSTPQFEKPMSPQFENACTTAGKCSEPPPTTQCADSDNTASLKKRSKALSVGDLSRRFGPSRATAAAAAAATTTTTTTTTTTEINPPPPQVPSRDPSPNDSSPKLWKHARSLSLKEISTVPAPVPGVVVVAPVCVPESVAASVRDMGTQMTPAESLRNSTCTTPGLTTSPARSGSSRRAWASSLGAFPGAGGKNGGESLSLELQSCHLAKLELRKLAGDGGSTLDRNMGCWSPRKEDCGVSLREETAGRCTSTYAAQASAWEEAEQAKALARYEQKEAKIKIWEELQKAQAEAEMKKIEAKAEKILLDANEKMRGKMAVAVKKAAEMRAAAEAVRNEQATKAAERAQLIRKTGLVSPPRSSFTSCFLV